VRALSRARGLPTWDLPASPCLSSRLPYGTAVTHARLRQVEQAEEALHALGLREVRVRHFGTKARVELGTDEIARVEADGALRTAVHAAVRAAGYDAVVVEPYRRGRLNLDVRALSR
jgi:uncharacterized protein